MAEHRLNYHHLISQSTVGAAGPPVVNTVVDAQSQLYYRYLPSFHRAYARVRLLSVLRSFLRKQGMRDVGLPAWQWRYLPVLASECCALPGSFPQSLINGGSRALTMSGGSKNGSPGRGMSSRLRSLRFARM
jgi:hypothetical protein